MTDDAIRDLIERVESATGPSFALDCAIGQALRPQRESWPAYSASIDAAMTLLGPEAFWRLGNDGEGPDPAQFKAEVLSPMLHRLPYIAVCATPALALVAASLRARLTKGA